MNLFTKKMKMLTAVIPSDKSEYVVKALIGRGVMEFVRVEDLPEENRKLVQKHQSRISIQSIADMRARIESVFKQGNIQLPTIEVSDLEAYDRPDTGEVKRFLDAIADTISRERENQRLINQKINLVSELVGYVDKKEEEYYQFRVGTIEKTNTSDFEERISSSGAFLFNYNDYYMILSLKRDNSRLDGVLDRFVWTECSKPEVQTKAFAKAIELIKAKQKELESDKAAIQKKITDSILNKKEELSGYWKSFRVFELCEHVENHFSHTKNTTLFSGWVPAEKEKEIEAIINDECDGKCIIEWTDDTAIDRSKVPVSVSSAKILEPFEVIVDNYATPEYGSINPTPFVAISYMAMFALMFADIGQGFIIFLIGLLGTLDYKKHPMKKDGLLSRYLCRLLMYLGPASMFGGLLFGSTFGYSWIPALWFNYHAVVNGHAEGGLIHDVYGILGVTIKFGIIIIFTGLILNWINLIRKKRYLTLIFDKNGIMGGILYAVGIWACFYFVGSGYKSFPDSPLLVFGIAIPAFVIFLKGPVMAYVHAKQGHKEKLSQVIMDTIMEFLIDALEIFSGFLSNTLSFMRVAGLGIAHVSLMTAFEDMSAIPGNPVAKVLIMILGNVLVIAIEGLSAGIQALRLNYYEFFNRYFTGRGIAFSPISLKSRISTDN